jgi:hypothetical protein
MGHAAITLNAAGGPLKGMAMPGAGTDAPAAARGTPTTLH